MAAISFVAALYLRVGGDFSYFATDFVVLATAIYTAIAAAVFWSLRLYAGVWRYASLEDLVAIIRAATIITLVFLAAMFLVSPPRVYSPGSALPISWLVLLALLGGPRFVYRLFQDRRANDANERDGERRIPVLLIGAGDVRGVVHPRDQPGARRRRGARLDWSMKRAGGSVATFTVCRSWAISTISRRSSRGMDREGRRPQRLIVTQIAYRGAMKSRGSSLSRRISVSGLPRMPQLDDFRENIDGTPEIRPNQY